MKNDELLQRVLKLLDKGNVRYADRIFEEERAKLAQDIDDYFKAPAKPALDPEVARLRELAEQHGQCSYCELDIATEGHATGCKRPYDATVPSILEIVAAISATVPDEEWDRVAKQDPPRPPPPECEKCGNPGSFAENGRWWCHTCNPPKRVSLPVIK